MYNRPQKLAAEFVGTFALVFFGVGAIVADQFLRTGGNAQAGMGLLGVALAQGLAVGIMVTALGHISGGHFNPAVTVGFWVTRRFSLPNPARSFQVPMYACLSASSGWM